MTAPRPGTLERWAWDYVHATSLDGKLTPPDVHAGWDGAMAPVRLTEPGRPPELRVAARADKTRGLGSPLGRARVLHTFFHHELQAAELMAWAVLAFPDTPVAFRSGLVRIARDEIRHMQLYGEQIARLGHAIGDFAVRDWFWTRVPTAPDPGAFVAVMGLGLESANLEHAATFSARFRDAGDTEAARVQELVGREEIAHVRFGARWFAEFRGPLTFAAWTEALPPPLTPLLMRGAPIAREARLRAGQPETFVDELTAWQPSGS